MYKYLSENVFENDEKLSVQRVDLAFGEDIETHTHDFIEIVYVSNGRGIHTVNGVEYQMKKGSLLFINYKQTHSYKPSKCGMVIYNILIKPEFFSEKLLNSENAFELLSLTAFEEFAASVDEKCPYISFDKHSVRQFENLLFMILDEYTGKRQGRDSMLTSLTNALMLFIFRNMSQDNYGCHRNFETVAGNIIKYIEEHYHEKISLKDLSNRCFYNPSYFSRMFKDTYSITITEFVLKTRIEKSIEILIHTDQTAEEISLAVGYTDKTKFYRDFKKITGKTPAEYRKNIH